MKKVAVLAFATLLAIGCMAKTGTHEIKEIGRDGRFIAYDNGTVKDTTTDLMWAAKDNGGPISWDDAKVYCMNYGIGGYSDWRMPTQEELTALYDPKIVNTRPPADGCKGGYHITHLIHITCCCIWSWNGRTEVETFFHFDLGPKGWKDQSLTYHPRALPVRNAR